MTRLTPLYQALLNALPAWPYGPTVQRAYCVAFK
jgi:hypothetical protein